jgi:hypothetical protein
MRPEQGGSKSRSNAKGNDASGGVIPGGRATGPWTAPKGCRTGRLQIREPFASGSSARGAAISGGAA